jgi:hypothetical protein
LNPNLDSAEVKPESLILWAGPLASGNPQHSGATK